MKVKLNKPFVSQIELTNACNLKCPMCPRTEHMKRKIKYIDENLFKNIIDEISTAIPKNKNRLLRLHHFGESLLHPKFFQLSQYARNKGIKTGISSNAMLLNKKRRRNIINNLDVLFISFDGINKETYEKYRIGGNFEKAKENILNLINEKGNKKPEIIISTLLFDDIQNQKEKYKNYWKNKRIKVRLKNPHGWRGTIKKFTNNKKIPQYPCSYLFNSLVVLVDGRVVPCCLDFNGEIILGDLNKKSIREIWTSKKYNTIRTTHLNGLKKRIKLCSKCKNYPSLKIKRK